MAIGFVLAARATEFLAPAVRSRVAPATDKFDVLIGQ